jgi:hypothetical protein
MNARPDTEIRDDLKLIVFHSEENIPETELIAELKGAKI